MGQHFLSYARVDQAVALRLCDTLEAGPPPIDVWIDQRDEQPGRDWDEQLVEAIRTCESLLFVMTPDSVEDASGCKQEWTRALRYKKPIVPLKLHPDADLPYRLEPRQYIDFTGSFEVGLARLRRYLQRLASPAGALQALQDRLADAERDLRRARDAGKRARIADDIAELERQIAYQQRVVDEPGVMQARVQESIARGQERERQPETPLRGVSRGKFINPPPLVPPAYFQDRHVETGLLGAFLRDEAQRLALVAGRGGSGKTAMVCRMLKALEQGRLPEDGGALEVDGIVYLSGLTARRLSMPHLYADLSALLPGHVADQLDALYRDPQVSTEDKMRTLLPHFATGRTVLLLDNFEDVVDPATLAMRDAELEEALRALLRLPPHGVKVIVTTRVAPRALALLHPERQARIDLDEGLPLQEARHILRAMDTDGKLGLKDATDTVLNEACVRTQGYPRALEALVAILRADRDTSLREILDDTARQLPDYVMEVLVGEAVSRLDAAAQQVLQALAIYARPATPTAIDYLLEPYVPGINSAPILNRLVNMLFARKESESRRYYLHPVDRAYTLGHIPAGVNTDHAAPEAPPFMQSALRHRGAEYFKEVRTPREDWTTIEDLEPQLAEFELRCEGGEYDTAASVLREIDFDYLQRWGFYQLAVQLHERLRDRLSDPWIALCSATSLGSAYYRQADYEAALACLQQALADACAQKERQTEGICLNLLGNCYRDLGQTARAFDYYEQALSIAREIGARKDEGIALGNLGINACHLGQTSRAIDYYEQALAICQNIGDRLGEGTGLVNLAEALIAEGRYEEAGQRAREATRIAAEIGSPLIGSASYETLTFAHLCAGDLVDARAAVDTARQYDRPDANQSVLALGGVIALRQGDVLAAQEAFAAAIAQADALLHNHEQNYRALDAKGLALCGLAICGDRAHIAAADEAYHTARAINSDAGIVAEALRLFDALAISDMRGVLAGRRAAAAGH